MKNALHVSDEVSLPLDLVTESNGILGKKGSGKTSSGVVLYEEMYAAGVPVVVVDPKGDWYGIRSSADGKSEGLPVPVFGGRHGDIPLESTAGTVIADLILRERLSCVLDVSEFSLAERRRFLTPFADRLYRAAERDPMHVFLEESHEYIPQFVKGDDAAMVGVFERLVKNGRFKGIGVTLLSQRSASLNKNVLTQIDNLFVMRTIAAQDRAAVKGWVEVHADAAELLASLPSLPTGECWLWQPSRGEPKRFRFRMRTTFDAGATPKVGEVRVTPTNLADVDLTAIAAAMAETIEKAKADDPKTLRATLADQARRIVQLEEQLATQPAGEPLQVPVVTQEQIDALDRLSKVLGDISGPLSELRADVGAKILDVEEVIAKLNGAEFDDLALGAHQERQRSSAPSPRATPARPAPSPLPPRTATAPRSAPATTSGVTLGKAQRLVLTVLAQRGVQTQQQVSMLTGYAVNGGGFNNALGSLRSAGYIVGSKDALEATAEGLAALGEYEPMPAGRALVDFWLAKCGKAEKLALETLVTAWPQGLDRATIAEACGYAANGGGFNNALGRLRTLTLIHGQNGGLLYASDELGEAARA